MRALGRGAACIPNVPHDYLNHLEEGDELKITRSVLDNLRQAGDKGDG